MGIGLGIFLIVIGGILKFGITADLSGLDLGSIGDILMVAGVAVVVLTLVLMAMRNTKRDTTSRTHGGDSDVI